MCQKAHEQCGTLTAQGKKNALLAWSLELRPCITGRLKPAHWRHVWGGTRPQGTPRYFCHEGHIEKTPSIYKSATALVSEKSHAQPLHSPLSGVLMETNGSATYSGAQCRTVCALETNGRPVCAKNPMPKPRMGIEIAGGFFQVLETVPCSIAHSECQPADGSKQQRLWERQQRLWERCLGARIYARRYPGGFGRRGCCRVRHRLHRRE